MHIIEAYRLRHGISQEEFARLVKNANPKIKVSRMLISHVENGRREPSSDLALAIEQATRGEIKAEWLIFPEKYQEEIEEYLNKNCVGVQK